MRRNHVKGVLEEECTTRICSSIQKKDIFPVFLDICLENEVSYIYPTAKNKICV